MVDLALRAEEAGADAVGVHGRTRAQRYRQSARWDLIDEVAQAVDDPGARQRRPADALGSGAAARAKPRSRSFLVARGALIKPWIFQELAEGRALDPSVPERWAVMRRYLRSGPGALRGRRQGHSARARQFLPLALEVLAPLPSLDRRRIHAEHLPDSLIQARNPRGGRRRRSACCWPAMTRPITSSSGDRVLDRDYPAA